MKRIRNPRGFRFARQSAGGWVTHDGVTIGTVTPPHDHRDPGAVWTFDGVNKWNGTRFTADRLHALKALVVDQVRL